MLARAKFAVYPEGGVNVVFALDLNMFKKEIKSYCDLDWLKNNICALSINFPGFVVVLKIFSNH